MAAPLIQDTLIPLSSLALCCTHCFPVSLSVMSYHQCLLPPGVPLLDGGTVRLPALIGLSRALDMILTGRPVPAQEAHTMGRHSCQHVSRTVMLLVMGCVEPCGATMSMHSCRIIAESVAYVHTYFAGAILYRRKLIS